MLTWLKNVYFIIPDYFRNRFLKYAIFSFANIFLDLVSIAYVVPIIVFIIDKKKLNEILAAFDLSIPMNSPSTIYYIIGALLLLFTVKNLLQVSFNSRLFVFLHQMASHLSTRYVAVFLKSSYLDFQKINKGDVFQEVLKITTHFSVNLLHSVILLLTESIFFIVLLITLGYFYPKITLIVLLGLLSFSALIYSRKRLQIRLINNTYKEAFAKVNSLLLNILDGYLEIRSSGKHPYFIQKFDEQNQKLNKVTAILVAFSHNYSKYLEICLIFGVGVLVYTNFLNQSDDQIILVSLIGAFGIKIIPSLTKILNALTMVKSHAYTVQELKQVEQSDASHQETTSFQHTIELLEVSFNYRSDLPLIDQLDLTIKKGEITAIRGVSGAGKTTILYIVAGFIEPHSGSIKLDQVDFDFLKYSPSFGYVTQQPFLFQGSLLDNIIMGQEKEKIDLEYISFLLKNLELEEVINREKNGLNTLISHNTPRLSGGQKQRLALARALYMKPDILILDEATNQQNRELEQRIYTFLKTLINENDMAILTVTHSENSLELFDSVSVLKDGKLVKGS